AAKLILFTSHHFPPLVQFFYITGEAARRKAPGEGLRAPITYPGCGVPGAGTSGAHRWYPSRGGVVHTRQFGPSRALSSPYRAGVRFTRSPLSNLMRVAFPWAVSFRCTSDGPGWVVRMPRRRSTTGGTHRAEGRVSMRGWSAPAVMSGMVT